MELQFTKDKFESLGTLKEFCDRFGACEVTCHDLDKQNIYIVVKSEQEIEFKLYCSHELSNIIRNDTTLDISRFAILRVSNNDGTNYIRVSQRISHEVKDLVATDFVVTSTLSLEDLIN